MVLMIPVFAVATAIAMIVVYDATGIRRQAGMQAQKINILVEEYCRGIRYGRTFTERYLGHTPVEAWGECLLGLAVALGLWFVW